MTSYTVTLPNFDFFILQSIIHSISINLFTFDVLGSPVKAERLQGCTPVDLSDPRPAHLRMRPDRQERVANLVTNYVALTGSNIGARYLSGAADLQEAARDHDYFSVPFT